MTGWRGFRKYALVRSRAIHRTLPNLINYVFHPTFKRTRSRLRQELHESFGTT